LRKTIRSDTEALRRVRSKQTQTRHPKLPDVSIEAVLNWQERTPSLGLSGGMLPLTGRLTAIGIGPTSSVVRRAPARCFLRVGRSAGGTLLWAEARDSTARPASAAGRPIAVPGPGARASIGHWQSGTPGSQIAGALGFHAPPLMGGPRACSGTRPGWHAGPGFRWRSEARFFFVFAKTPKASRAQESAMRTGRLDSLSTVNCSVYKVTVVCCVPYEVFLGD
jgi:hypothetical protein